MKRSIWPYIFVSSLALLPADASAVEAQAEEEENRWAPYVEPNRRVERAMHFLAAMPQAERDKALEMGRTSVERWGDAYIGLEDEAGGRREFVLQLLHFDEAHKSHFEGTTVLGVFKMRGIHVPDLVAATAQFLESEDIRVRTKAEEFLLAAQVSDPDNISIEQARDHPDFIVPAEIFRRERETVPRGLEPLARHMFAKDPEQAIRRLADVYLDAARRDELTAVLAESEGAEGLERELSLLRKLIQPNSWWSEKWFVQLYVAEKACSDRDLADEDVLKRLRATEHLIVWQRLKRATAESEAGGESIDDD